MNRRTLVPVIVLSMMSSSFGQDSCGHQDRELRDELASFRIVGADDIQSWVLSKCSLAETSFVRFTWIAFEHEGDDWAGVADWAVWEAIEVERGCADNNSATLIATNVINTREPLLDDDGNQIFVFGGSPVWIYSVAGRGPVPPGEWYFGVRNVVVRESSASFIPFVAECFLGETPVYFQSNFFGFPCAVPGRKLVGGDFCAAVVIKSLACDRIRRYKVTCRDGKIKARVKSSLVEGTELTIDNDGDVRTMVIDDRGRGKVKWRRQTGPHTVCILECPDMCETADCGG